VNREQFYAIMQGEGTLDYEVYLRTKALLSCQTDYAELCNKDELQFQLVHQVEELWMKLIAYTLLDIDEYLQQEDTNRVLTLFRRIHWIQRMMIEPIWSSFEQAYLNKHGLNVEKVYDSQYDHGDAYVVAEALAEFDELFQKFRYEHMQLIHRTIGFGSKSLKGRPVEILEDGMRHKFFPQLWEIRNEMTDKWGTEYGVKRDPIGGLH
jgi:tryptophan 2,3-dioxygenase